MVLSSPPSPLVYILKQAAWPGQTCTRDCDKGEVGVLTPAYIQTRGLLIRAGKYVYIPVNKN